MLYDKKLDVITIDSPDIEKIEDNKREYLVGTLFYKILMLSANKKIANKRKQ